jgi:uncharacterized membrane protein YqhA
MWDWIEVLSPLLLPVLAGLAVAVGWYGAAVTLALWTLYPMFNTIEKHLDAISRHTENR